jgi:hypothetical protein
MGELRFPPLASSVLWQPCFNRCQSGWFSRLGDLHWTDSYHFEVVLGHNFVREGKDMKTKSGWRRTGQGCSSYAYRTVIYITIMTFDQSFKTFPFSADKSEKCVSEARWYCSVKQKCTAHLSAISSPRWYSRAYHEPRTRTGNLNTWALSHLVGRQRPGAVVCPCVHTAWIERATDRFREAS